MQKKFNNINISAVECSVEEVILFYQKVGRKVQKMRKKKGLSQLELTYLIGLKSTSLVAGAEASYNNIRFSLEHLYKIAKVLNCDVKEFFD